MTASRRVPAGALLLGLVGLLALPLAACSEDGLAAPPVWTRDGPDEPGYLVCDGAPGAPRVELTHPAGGHEPAGDGAVYELARRPQGDVTIFAPLWFGGLDGGDVVDDFELLFTVQEVGGEPEVVGRRAVGTMRLPCEEDGTVAADWLEVFFGNPSIPPSSWDGVEGELEVGFTTAAGESLHDSVQARLVAVE